MGVVGSTLFISIQAAIDPAHTAVAASTLYLASSVGSVLGMASSSAVLQGSLRVILDRKLSEGGFDGHKKFKVCCYALPYVCTTVDGWSRLSNEQSRTCTSRTTQSLELPTL